MNNNLAIDHNNEHNLADLLSFSPTIIYRAVPSGDFQITYISVNLHDILGYHPEEIYKDNDFWHDHIHADDRPNVFQNLTQLFVNNQFVVDYRFCHQAGHYLWVHDQLHLVRDDKNNVIDVVGSITDITQRKNIEESIRRNSENMEIVIAERTAELTVARDAALNAEKIMSTFLSNMSHELRTPLHGILSFANFGIKKYQKAKPEKLKQYFTEIHDSGKNLLALINNLLDLSKLRAGKVVYDFEPAALDDVIQNVARELRLLAKERQIDIDYQNQMASIDIVMDRIKMAQVVRNLLSNAIKFSNENSVITLTLDTDSDNNHRIQVADQGVGIPEDECELIFEAFLQSSKTRTNAGGTGLGLPICKEIVEVGHQGSIRVNNRPKGGTIFTVTLPIEHEEREKPNDR